MYLDLYIKSLSDCCSEQNERQERNGTRQNRHSVAGIKASSHPMEETLKFWLDTAVEERCVEAMRNGDSISLRSGWRVVSLPFLVNCFLLPECKEIKVFLTHFCSKCTVPLLLNSL